MRIIPSVPPLATQAEAETGLDNYKRMSPLRSAQAIAAQGGGGGEILVGPGQTFLNVRAAVASITTVEKNLPIRVIGDTIEDADINLNAGFFIRVHIEEGVTVDLQGFGVTGNAYEIEFTGKGTLRQNAASVYTSLLKADLQRAVFQGISIQLESTTSDHMTSGVSSIGFEVYMRDVVLTTGTSLGSGVTTGNNEKWVFENVTFVARSIFSVNLNTGDVKVASGITIDTQAGTGVRAVFGRMFVSLITVLGGAGAEIQLYGTVVGNILIQSPDFVSFYYGGRLLASENVGELRTQVPASVPSKAEQAVTSNANVVIDQTEKLVFEATVFPQAATVAANQLTIRNCYFQGDLTISGTDVRIVDCIIDGSLTISGTRTIARGNRVGTGGSAATISITGNDNIVSENYSDNAISDTGTGNLLNNNIVF